MCALPEPARLCTFTWEFESSRPYGKDPMQKLARKAEARLFRREREAIKGALGNICMHSAAKLSAFLMPPRCMLRITACHSSEVSIPSLRTVS